MAATIATSIFSQNRTICKSNIKSNALDRKNPMHTNPNIHSVNQLPSVSKSNHGCNEHKSARSPEFSESQKSVLQKNDLVWAKFKNHSWWPGRILNDINKIGENNIYFVELIGSSPERDWVSDSNIFRYAGIDSFKKYAQDQVDQAQSKSAQEELVERFQLKIATNKREDWEMAIHQADFIIAQTDSSLNQNKIEKRKRENLDFKEKSIECSPIKLDNIQNNPPALISTEKVKKTKQNEINFEENFDYNNNGVYGKSETLSSVEQVEEEQLSEENYQDTTLTSLLNEKKNLVQRFEKKRGRKPKPEVWTSNIVKTCAKNQLKLKLKLNNSANNYSGINLSDEELDTSPRRKSNKSSSASSRSSRSSSSSSTSSCSSSDSSTCSSSDSNELPEIKKNYSPTSSIWSSSTDYELNSSFAKNLSDSVVEKINLKKQNARKSSTSFCFSSPTSSLPTPTKRKSTCKQTARKRNSKSFSEQTTIDSLLFDENNVFSSAQTFNEGIVANGTNGNTSPETYLIDRYKYAVRHIKQGLSVEEACNKYRISKGALLKCLSGGTAPRGKKTRLTESEENEIVEWLIGYKDLKYNDAIHLVFQQVAQKFELAQRPNPFNNGKPSMDWWYDFLSRHPQIMASKPDWLKRGKVNDQYIRDVQSGQLKCTKFRRALLSAIQYIKSLNDPASTSILESVTGTSSSSASVQETKSKGNQKCASNGQKTNKAKSAKVKTNGQIGKNDDESMARMFLNSQISDREYQSHQQTNNHTNMYPNLILNTNCVNESHYQTNIHNRNNSNCSSTTITTNSLDYNDEDLSSVSPISLLNSNLTKKDFQLMGKNENLFIDSKSYDKSSDLFSQFVTGNENLSDDDEDECMDNLDDNFEDGQNASVTYRTEIFNSELEDNALEDFMNPNMIKKDFNVHSSNIDQAGFINHQIFHENKYSNEIMLNVRYQDTAQSIDPNSFISIKQQPMEYDNQLLDIEPIASSILDDRTTYTNMYHNNLSFSEQNLLMRHENDEIDDNHRLIHPDENLICDSIYQSAYLH